MKDKLNINKENLFWQVVSEPKVYFMKLFKRTLVIGVYTFLLSLLYVNSKYYHVQIPASMHSLIGIVIGLLLVFRTNTAYDRWWEGRKLFSTLSTSISYFSIKLNSCCTDVLVKAQARNIIKQILRNLSDYLRETNADNVMGHHNKQTKLVCDMLLLIRDAKLSDRDLNILEDKLNEIVDISNSFERIKSTPIPKAYALHIKASIFIYLLSLPFGLFHDLGLWAAAMVMVVFYIVAGIEIISNEIENPFADDPNDLPIDTYFKQIKDSMNIIKESVNSEYGKYGKETPK